MLLSAERGASGRWHTFVDTVVGPSFSNFLHLTAYVGEGFDAVQFAGFDYGVDCRCSFASRLRAGEESVATPDSHFPSAHVGQEVEIHYPWHQPMGAAFDGNTVSSAGQRYRMGRQGPIVPLRSADMREPENASRGADFLGRSMSGTQHAEDQTALPTPTAALIVLSRLAA
jgi:hypothetical protein